MSLRTKLDVLGFTARKFILQGYLLRIPSNMILLRYFLLHLKSMKYNMYQVWYTANIINAIFTLFMGVPDSTVIPPYFLHLIIDIQWFTATSALLHCMANTCNLYAFLWVSEFPLHICIYLQCRYLPFSTQCILLF